MTNAELSELTERISEIAVILVMRCHGDRERIDEGLWKRLVELCKQADEYI